MTPVYFLSRHFLSYRIPDKNIFNVNIKINKEKITKYNTYITAVYTYYKVYWVYKNDETLLQNEKSTY